MGNISEDRPLSQDERALVRWLIEHGEPEASRFLSQLDDARVTSRCGCGCASVNFAVRGQTPSCASGLDVLSDYYWHDGEGHALGVFVFACEETLAGLELYSMDGLSSAGVLPRHEQLIPVGTPTA
jgi:hypothetical protein